MHYQMYKSQQNFSFWKLLKTLCEEAFENPEGIDGKEKIRQKGADLSASDNWHGFSFPFLFNNVRSL